MTEWGFAQDRIAKWQRAIYPSGFDTPTMHFNRSLEEFRELRDAIREDDGTAAARKEIGAEAVDVIIRMIGIATVVNTNISLELPKKVIEMTQKYPPGLIQGDLEHGVPFNLAMARQKAQWRMRAG